MAATTLPAETQTPRWLPMLGGIAALILGALMLTAPGETSVVVIQCLGLYWLVAGIFSIVRIFLDRTRWGWELLGGGKSLPKATRATVRIQGTQTTILEGISDDSTTSMQAAVQV